MIPWTGILDSYYGFVTKEVGAHKILFTLPSLSLSLICKCKFEKTDILQHSVYTTGILLCAVRIRLEDLYKTVLKTF